jgi:hypothetical protein
VTLLSLVLVIVAAIAFLLGLLQDGLELIYVSIATAIASMVALGIGVVLARRREARAAPAGYGTTRRAAPAVARPRRDGEPTERGSEERDGSATSDEGVEDRGPETVAEAASTDREVVRKVTGTPVAAAGADRDEPVEADAPADGGAAPTARGPAKKAVARRQVAAAPAPAAAEPSPRPSGSLDDVESLGSAQREALLARFGSEDAIAAASVTQLTQVPGIGTRLAKAVKDALS